MYPFLEAGGGDTGDSPRELQIAKIFLPFFFFFLVLFPSIHRAGLIIAGWDERHGGQVYSIPIGGSLHKQAYAIGGSGSTYIYGFCDANWEEAMDQEDAVDFVKDALREAIKWDGSSGGVIRMVVMTARGAERHLYLPNDNYSKRQT